MKVLVDPTIFSYGRCGMTRYYSALCNGLETRGVALDVPMLSTNCDFAYGIARYTRRLRRLKAGVLLDALSQHWFRHRVRRGGFDCILVTSPSFDSSFLKLRPRASFVMVVHDLMTCVPAPDGLYDAAGPGLAKLLALAARATRVICISEATRQALLQHGIVDESRVAVVRTGNLLAARHLPEKHLHLPERYILFVGERSGRKGFYPLIRTLADIFDTDTSLQLVCTGRLSDEERYYLDCHGVLERVHAVSADDSALQTLYRRAVCLVYPSLYEGFGLPVLEAMHCGCPVITTTRGALEEVGGDAALLFDPDHPDQLRDALRKMLYDPTVARRCAQLGTAHARQFSFEVMISRCHQELLAAVMQSRVQEQG